MMPFVAANAQHIGARRSQQDSFAFGDPRDRDFMEHAGLVAVLCDGMGGMEYGDAASRAAVRGFLEAYRRKTPAEPIPDALERSAREANREVLALAESLGLVEGMGTTLAAAVLDGVSVFYVSVGDSAVFHVSTEGIRMLNRPHIFANVLDAAAAQGSISAHEAAQHPERDSLTSYIGARNLEEIDRNVEPVALAEGDAILLASDGLFKVLSAEEMRECCAGPPQAWPEMLVDRTIAKKREYQDNVTVLSLAPGSAGAEPITPARANLSLTVILLCAVALALIAGAAWWWHWRSGGSGKGVQARPAGVAAPDPKSSDLPAK